MPTFDEAQRYLLGTIDELVSRRTSYKLDRMRAFLRELDDPHRRFPAVHIGGTSGKSSTSTMVASALQASGLRTGLHTKPHLHSMTERARIDGRAISPERFATLLGEMMPAIERTAVSHGRPTFYETLLALAFVYFARERVDAAVIEVGLGGRLDGTNVLEPLVAAITSVGYDHTDVLGASLEEIALEKAGIAKHGVPLVLAPMPPPARAVVERYAAGVGARVVDAGDVVSVEPASHAPTGVQLLRVVSQRGSYMLELPALGIFQRTNAATAIAILEQLGDDLRPSPADIARGFAGLAIPGRMESAGGHPAVVFDIAHNPEKAQSLTASLREHFAGKRIHFVVAVGETKDARTIVETLASVACSLTFTSFTVTGRRAVAPARLAALAESLGTWGRAIADPIEALTVARRRAEFDDVVVVTGSTFIVAELREWYAPAPV
jgi:dihydrofolate synthase / folylpolyglutamate synthase